MLAREGDQRGREVVVIEPAVRDRGQPHHSGTDALVGQFDDEVLGADATPELRERELHKMASLATAFNDGLRERGVAPVLASLAAETGVAVFRIAFERWITDPGGPDLADVMRSTLADLAGLTAR